MLQNIRHLIDGALKTSNAGSAIQKRSPFNQDIVYDLIPASPLDFVAALRAANQAQQPGKGLPLDARQKLLLNLANLVRESAHELALISAADQGVPYSQVLKYDVLKTASIFEHHAQSSIEQSSPASYGVVGIIASRVWPLSTIAQILAPAFLSGASVIVKPSTRAAAAPARLAEIIASLETKGLIQFVFGEGATIGELMASHPGIDFLAFSGRTETGHKVAQTTSQSLKPASLKLTAKNAAVILDDADLKQAADLIALAAFAYSGQTPESISRVMISEKRETEFLELLKQSVNDLKITDPNASDCRYGCLLSSQQVTEFHRTIETLIHEKGQVLQPYQLDHSHAVAPTIIQGLHNCSDVHQTDVMGPLIVMVPTKYLHESTKWANTTPYGQSALVVGSDENRIHKAAQQLHVEHIWINQWQPEKEIEWNVGLKNSGWGMNLINKNLFWRQTRLLP